MMINTQNYKFSKRTHSIRQSGIRTAGSRCTELGGINLGQGVCEVSTPEIVKQAAVAAIKNDNNTYSTYEGIMPLREAVARKIWEFNHVTADPSSEIMISSGSTGSFVCAVNALFNPGDEVILFEPFYEYHRNILELHQVVIKTVNIDLKNLSIDFDKLKEAIGHKTRGIVICTPCNPCGKVFSTDELITIGMLAEEFDLYAITDEIYEYITYPGFEHISLASLRDFKNRTITISGFSKTYSMTGWRLGYAYGPAPIINRMALVHDLLYICPATPLQYGAIAALNLDKSYYLQLANLHLRKRDLTIFCLREVGFKVSPPQGAYYIMADFSTLDFLNDEQATRVLLNKAKVATVAGRSFYIDPIKGQYQLRVCYALEEERILQGLGQIKEAIEGYKT